LRFCAATFLEILFVKSDGVLKREEKLDLGKLLKEAKENGRQNNAPDYKLVNMQLIIVEHSVHNRPTIWKLVK